MEQSTKTINDAITTYSTLITTAVDKSFKFPKGGANARLMENWYKAMENNYGALSSQRVVDYCVTQAYFAKQMNAEYIPTIWKPSHTFSATGNCMDRFHKATKQVKYYEDRWLKEIGISRASLLNNIVDKSVHPLDKFVHPVYEERTKAVFLNEMSGWVLCGEQTLLFTPFSDQCKQCKYNNQCQERTNQLYPELYRLRMEKWNKGGKK